MADPIVIPPPPSPDVQRYTKDGKPTIAMSVWETQMMEALKQLAAQIASLTP